MLVSRSELTQRWKHLGRGQGRQARGKAEGSRGLGGREGSSAHCSPDTEVWLSTGPPSILLWVPSFQTTDSSPGASGHVTRPGS